MERTFPERPQIGSPYNKKAEYTKEKLTILGSPKGSGSAFRSRNDGNWAWWTHFAPFRRYHT